MFRGVAVCSPGKMREGSARLRSVHPDPSSDCGADCHQPEPRRHGGSRRPSRLTSPGHACPEGPSCLVTSRGALGLRPASAAFAIAIALATALHRARLCLVRAKFVAQCCPTPGIAIGSSGGGRPDSVAHSNGRSPTMADATGRWRAARRLKPARGWALEGPSCRTADNSMRRAGRSQGALGGLEGAWP